MSKDVIFSSDLANCGCGGRPVVPTPPPMPPHGYWCPPPPMPMDYPKYPCKCECEPEEPDPNIHESPIKDILEGENSPFQKYCD